MSDVYSITLAALASLGIAATASAGERGAITQPAEIDRAVADFTGKAVGQEGGAITRVDPRLRLAACVSPLSLAWYGAPGRTVSVACPGPDGWQIYVNLGQAPRARAAAPTIRRGEVVTIAFRGRGFSVQQQGEARSNGAVGEWIEVRTDRKSPTLRARVARPGLVTVEQQ